KAELHHAPSPEQLSQLFAGAATVEPDPAPEFDDVDQNPSDGRVTLAKLEAYYRRGGIGPLQLVHVPAGALVDLRSAVLFRQLHRNEDDKLSREEVQTAPQALRSLDSNDDELISDEELSSLVRDRLDPGTIPPLPEEPSLGPFLLRHPGDPPEALVQQFLTRY